MRGPVLLAVLALLAAAVPASAAERQVPRGWLGAVADGPMAAPESAAASAEWDRMATHGVESVRVAVYWDEHQPVATAAELPSADAPRFRAVRGVPTDFSRTDAVVAAAAARGLQLLPVVLRAPAWAAHRPGDLASPPADPATYAAFVAALVRRYGPRGSLWRERPELRRLPVRAWQVWNEPNLTSYWSAQPFARSYVALLRAARRAIRRADPGARVVLAGLPNRSWTALRAIYRAGGRGAFDAVALHPFTGLPRFVMKLIRLARREMRRHGDGRRPIWVTELSWPASAGRDPRRGGFEVTDAGQADRLEGALRRLRTARRPLRIERVYWYTWLSTEAGPSAFDWSGLRRVRGGAIVDAPALAVFTRWARRLQGCAKAPGDARRCR
jgi:hypothetical protein